MAIFMKIYKYKCSNFYVLQSSDFSNLLLGDLDTDSYYENQIMIDFILKLLIFPHTNTHFNVQIAGHLFAKCINLLGI